MKKFFCLFLIVLLILCFWGCDASDTFIRIDYASKIDGGRDVFSITHIKAADKEGERVKIKRTDFDEFDEMIRQSDNFFGMDKVYNVNNETFLYQGNECYILTNGDTYFALGENQDGYYQLSELKATFNFYDENTDKFVFKSFTIFPYLNTYVYNGLPSNVQPNQAVEDILVWIPYEWNYIKLFYSRLEYAEIDEEQKKITINAYTGSSDTQFTEHDFTWIDEISFYFVKEDNLNYIKFTPDNFNIIDNDID